MKVMTSPNSVGAMIAFAFMSSTMETYLNETLRLKGGFDGLIDALHFRPILDASRKVFAKINANWTLTWVITTETRWRRR